MQNMGSFGVVLLGALLLVWLPVTVSMAAPNIIDHNAVDRCAGLTDTVIGAVQDTMRWHYAHTSHGSQVTTGLQRLESADPLFSVAIAYRSLPAAGDSQLRPRLGNHWFFGCRFTDQSRQ